MRDARIFNIKDKVKNDLVVSLSSGFTELIVNMDKHFCDRLSSEEILSVVDASFAIAWVRHLIAKDAVVENRNPDDIKLAQMTLSTTYKEMKARLGRK